MSTKPQKAKVRNYQEWILIRRTRRAMNALHRINPLKIYESMSEILEQEERRNVGERNARSEGNGSN